MDRSITYIIVTWNNEKEIEQCLKTIEKFSNNEHCIIVVDNASSDNTVTIVRNCFEDVKLICNQDNVGFAKANNIGLELVKTPYVCFINPDVILTEDIVTPSVNELERNGKVGLIACRLNNSDGSWQPSTFSFANSRNLYNEILHIGAFMPQFICKRKYINYYRPTKKFYPDWVIGAEMIMRTIDARSIDGFSTEYYMYTEDMDLCKKVNAYLHKLILFLPSPSLIHLGGASESQNVNYNKQKKLFENDIRFVEKFYGKKEALKTKKKMINAFRTRLNLLKALYKKSDRDTQIRKTKKSIDILMKI